MKKKEFEKFNRTPEGGCLVLAAMWTFIVVFALVCSWIFESLYKKYSAPTEKAKTCIVFNSNDNIGFV